MRFDNQYSDTSPPRVAYIANGSAQDSSVPSGDERFRNQESTARGIFTLGDT